MAWKILVIAIGLVLVLEGVMPFLMPDRYKRFLISLAHMDPKHVRVMGFVMMVAGVVIIVAMKKLFGI